MPIYEFKQPDGTYKTQEVSSDLSNTAGFISGSIRLPQTKVATGTTSTGTTPTGITGTTQNGITGTIPTNPTQTTVQPASVASNTTPTNTQFQVLNPGALANFNPNDLTKPDAQGRIFVKAGVNIPQNLRQYVKQVSTPLISGTNVNNIIPQTTLQNISGDNTEQDALKRKIADGQAEYNKMVQEFASQASFDPLTKYQELQQQTGVLDLKKQLVNTDNALRNLENNIRNQYAGREITESQLQALIAKEAEPILRSRQYLADQVNSIMSSIENQIQLGQQGFTNRFNQMLQVLGLKKDTLADLKNELNNQLQLARTGRLDEINLAMTLAQLPKDFQVTLSDGTILKGGGMVDKNISQIKETDASGRTTVSFIDVNPDSPTFGQVVGKTDLGVVSKPQTSGSGGGGTTPQPDIKFTEQQKNKLKAYNLGTADSELQNIFINTLTPGEQRDWWEEYQKEQANANMSIDPAQHLTRWLEKQIQSETGQTTSLDFNNF